MTDTQIMLKILQIANDNGYDTYYAAVLEDHKIDIGGMYLTEGEDEKETICIREIIFDPEFAKALWGEVDDCADIQIYSTFNKNTPYRWQYHLSKMVLEKEPLKYLEKFL